MFELHTKGVTEKVTLKQLPTLRQSFAVASLLIIVGMVLGFLTSPWFLALPLLVAFGLMLSATVGVCPMVLILQCMPWNKKKEHSL